MATDPDLFPTVTASAVTIDANAIAFALAKNEVGEKLPLGEVLTNLSLDLKSPALRNLLNSPLFKTQYGAFVRELRESGESFRLKARVQAEELLRTNWAIIHDPIVPAAVRMKGIENVVEWADLKPKKTAEGPVAPAITINIDLSAGAPEVITVVNDQPQLEDAHGSP
jgi:hypothetical protein